MSYLKVREGQVRDLFLIAELCPVDLRLRTSRIIEPLLPGMKSQTVQVQMHFSIVYRVLAAYIFSI